MKFNRKFSKLKKGKPLYLRAFTMQNLKIKGDYISESIC